MAAEITLQDMAAHLGTSRPDETLREVIDATVELVEGWKGAPIAEWPERWRLGTMMLIARIDRRRQSPSGVDTVTEMGPVYIARKDPEVAQLLEIGTWRKPVVA
ncbi:hypothetical protein HMPREF3153_09730 [Corynebacterium sp. HMSC06C06]|uniref:Phage protein n=1 Tax=Corynebacterium striatum TaxID=43770 RepID=A0ABX7DCU3_CORST|nr:MULTISPECIES: hypothetical protein [Corynebacterium]OFT50496.1 hypothetical protein HMPREF3153_09730 [Corynebacterium sp. HMSC06C06]QQU76450.1 hypothetical protein I6I72_10090 [Corynebacterium striatum]HCD1553131.1 hypothetical protein [Corynebacterium striatum]HCD1825958.1 hypothetical protein [Corynebacterium striatum]HCD2182114.1 hypothetical protein [Corynebacterium striatum]